MICPLAKKADCTNKASAIVRWRHRVLSKQTQLLLNSFLRLIAFTDDGRSNCFMVQTVYFKKVIVCNVLILKAPSQFHMPTTKAILSQRAASYHLPSKSPAHFKGVGHSYKALKNPKGSKAAFPLGKRTCGIHTCFFSSKTTSHLPTLFCRI